MGSNNVLNNNKVNDAKERKRNQLFVNICPQFKIYLCPINIHLYLNVEYSDIIIKI